jgi:hypothetical protein
MLRQPFVSAPDDGRHASYATMGSRNVTQSMLAQFAASLLASQTSTLPLQTASNLVCRSRGHHVYSRMAYAGFGQSTNLFTCRQREIEVPGPSQQAGRADQDEHTVRCGSLLPSR